MREISKQVAESINFLIERMAGGVEKSSGPSAKATEAGDRSMGVLNAGTARSGMVGVRIAARLAAGFVGVLNVEYPGRRFVGVLNVDRPGRPFMGVRNAACVLQRFVGVRNPMTRAAGFVGVSILLAASPVMASETLTVYTYESFVAEWGPGPIIKQGFEEQCGDCTVDFVALDSSAGILNRVQLEGENTRADIVLGLDTSLTAIAEDTGLLAESNVDVSKLELPIEWDSTIFVPYDYGYFSFVYDTEQLETPPDSFEALLAAPEEVRIIIQDPRTSTPGLGLLLWMRSVYGDDAAEKWAELQPRILTVTKGWSEAYFSLFLNEEAPMVLSYSTSPGYHMAVDKTDRYQAAAFTEGHYVQVEVAALLERSPHKALGREFLAYLHSSTAQESIPLGNVMYPVTDIGEAMPAEFDTLISPGKALIFDSETVRDNRRLWVDEWLEATTR